MQNKKQYRNSYGIAIFNRDKHGKLRILLIKKRNSYEYLDFICGKYKNTDAALHYMFDNMKISEKIAISTLNFEYIYYNAFLEIPRENKIVNAISKYVPKKYRNYYLQKPEFGIKSYIQKKLQFENNFLRDGGRRLMRIINQTKSKDSIWELPGGGKKSKGETDMDCAIREFVEETGIFVNFTIFNDIRPVKMLRETPLVNYYNFYYIAYMSAPVLPKIKTYNIDQIHEVENIKWMTLQDLRIVNTNYNIYEKFRPIFRAVRNRLRRI